MYRLEHAVLGTEAGLQTLNGSLMRSNVVLMRRKKKQLLIVVAETRQCTFSLWSP
jgi:hypothetical protein